MYLFKNGRAQYSGGRRLAACARVRIGKITDSFTIASARQPLSAAAPRSLDPVDRVCPESVRTPGRDERGPGQRHESLGRCAARRLTAEDRPGGEAP